MTLMGDRWKMSTMRVPCAELARTIRASPFDRCRSLSPGVRTLGAQTFEYPPRSRDETARLAGTFGPQWRIPVHIDPFSALRRHMTSATVRLVIGGRSPRRIPGIEPGPSPTLTPELVTGMPSGGVTDQDETTLQGVRVAHGSSGHGRGGRLEDLFY